MDPIIESPWLLLTVAGVVLIAASITRQARPEWGYWPLLAPLVIAAIAFGLDYMIKTDREQINGIISSAKKAAINGNPAGIMPFVSPEYADRANRSKTQLEAQLNRIFKNSGIKKISTRSHTIDIKGDFAVSQLNVIVHLDRESRYSMAGSIVFVGIQFDYEKADEKWLVERSEIISINDDPWPGSWQQIP